MVRINYVKTFRVFDRDCKSKYIFSSSNVKANLVRTNLYVRFVQQPRPMS